MSKYGPAEILALPHDGSDFVKDSDRDLVMQQIRSRTENKMCFDCSSRNPSWISISHGIFVCLSCSGNHRRMGVHISYVRSCTLDSFTREDLMRMYLGGNDKARAYYTAQGMAENVNYAAPSAQRYVQQLLDATKSAMAGKASLDAPLSSSSAAQSIPATPAGPSSAPSAADVFADLPVAKSTPVVSAPPPVAAATPTPSPAPVFTAREIKLNHQPATVPTTSQVTSAPASAPVESSAKGAAKKVAVDLDDLFSNFVSDQGGLAL